MAYTSDVEYALVSFACTFAPYDQRPINSISEFADGLAFAHMLATVENFPLERRELDGPAEQWVQRLSNLKLLLQRMENYLREGGKTLLARDIDLLEIARHSSSPHICRFFELVVAVFMQSPHKEDYIQTIMHLDERSQHALVVIVQNAIDERLVDAVPTHNDSQTLATLAEMNTENQLLRQELKEQTHLVQKCKRELLEAKERLEELQQLEEKYRHNGGVQAMGIAEMDQLKQMNENLKQKLLQTARDHEEDLSRAREENLFLQNKLQRFKEYEEAVDHLKEQLADVNSDRQRYSQLEKEKRRLSRLVEQKEGTIRQLKDKLEETSEKNYSMQQHELYMKMELEKKEVRFRQLQNEVKSRLKSDNFTPINALPVLPSPTETLDSQQIDYLQEQLQKVRTSYRQVERENLKLKKRLQKTQTLEAEKKKLQKIILDVSKSKDNEIELLLVSLYDLRTENIRIHSILEKK